jgi:hypothetical protein
VIQKITGELIVRPSLGVINMSRPRTPLAAIPCTFTRSAFPDELIFRIKTSDGSEHAGLSPVYYFWDVNRNPLEPDAPAEEHDTEGFIATHILKFEPGRVLVEVPDGSVAWVAGTKLVERPTEINIDVPIRS